MPVLDTAFVVDVLRKDTRATRLLRLLQQSSAPLGVSTFTIYELNRGIGRTEDAEEEQQRVEGFLRAVTVFHLEPQAARQAGMMDAQLVARGITVSLVDLLIGATAMHHGEAVVTRNVRDFQAIPGLDVLAY